MKWTDQDVNAINLNRIEKDIDNSFKLSNKLNMPADFIQKGDTGIRGQPGDFGVQGPSGIAGNPGYYNTFQEQIENDLLQAYCYAEYIKEFRIKNPTGGEI